jgi:hypothetical protein
MIVEIFSAIYPGTPPWKKIGGLSFSLSMTFFFLAVTLMVPCVRAQNSNAASAPESNIPPPPEENPGAAPTLLQIQAAVRANPKKAASILARALDAEQSHTITFAAQAVTASIRGLGDKAKRVAVGRIILAAVKSRPEAVLEIVREAIPQTIKAVHLEIVAAAASGIAAVSDPYMRVSVIAVESGALGYELCNSTSGDRPAEVVAGFTFDQCATLADEIAQMAFQSESNGSLVTVSNSINSVLQTHSTPDPFAYVGQLPINRPAADATPTPPIARTPLLLPDPVSP